jgi:hypothetical protein
MLGLAGGTPTEVPIPGVMATSVVASPGSQASRGSGPTLDRVGGVDLVGILLFILVVMDHDVSSV